MNAFLDYKFSTKNLTLYENENDENDESDKMMKMMRMMRMMGMRL